MLHPSEVFLRTISVLPVNCSFCPLNSVKLDDTFFVRNCDDYKTTPLTLRMLFALKVKSKTIFY